MHGMDMREYVTQQLNNMDSVQEKDMLRDILEQIFIPLYNHTEEQYDKLETRIKDEMPLITSSYVVWNTLMNRSNAKGGCPYMFPMLNKDLQMPEIEVGELLDKLREEGEIRLDSVFVQADYLECREIENSREIYNGTIKVHNDEIQVGIRLKLSKRYTKCIENLYKLFIANGIPWQTVNSPYIFKMFDVMMVRVNADNLEKYATKESPLVSSYSVSFGKHDQYLHKGIIPVWNVTMLNLKSEDFPLAALDKVNYE